MPQKQIGVIGSAGPEEYPGAKPAVAMYRAAEQLGNLLARKNAVVIQGAKGGVMAAVARGARRAGGLTVGEVSGGKRGTANADTDIEIVTYDLGFRGPSLLVGMSDAIIALGGGAGTLQELCVAYRMGKPVVLLTGYGGWADRLAAIPFLDERQLAPFTQATSPEDAVHHALAAVAFF